MRDYEKTIKVLMEYGIEVEDIIPDHLYYYPMFLKKLDEEGITEKLDLEELSDNLSDAVDNYITALEEDNKEPLDEDKPLIEDEDLMESIIKTVFGHTL